MPIIKNGRNCSFLIMRAIWRILSFAFGTNGATYLEKYAELNRYHEVKMYLEPA